MRWVAAIAGVVGFLYFLMEIVWYRMLGPLLGGSSFTFGLILALALAGIGLGGLLYALFGRASLPALAATCVLEAFCLIVPYALGDGIALLAETLRAFSVWGFPGLVLSWTAVAGIVVLPASLVAGYQFPLLIGLLGEAGGVESDEEIGRDVGMVYAWNTWGAILGSLAGGFGLMPLLTAPRLWWLCAALLILAGAVAGMLHLGRGGVLRDLSAAAAIGVFGAVLCAADGPSSFWRHTAIGAGRAAIDVSSPNDFRFYRNSVRRRVIAEAEGVESSVALVAANDLSLMINGKSDGSARGDGATQVLTGLIGAALHPEPRSALVIGFGTGATAGWLAQVPEMEQVDIVELEPAVVELAEPYEPLNLDVLEAPNATLRYGDGREDILARDARYDIIFSEPSNPYRAGVADLFSQDFYRAVISRLNEGGMLLQWLQGYEIDPFVVRSVYTTIQSVFPEVETWMTLSGDLLLIATKEPLRHDLRLIEERVRSEPWRRALRVFWRVEGLEGLFTGFLADGRLARAMAEEGEISSDDRPVIEFGFARSVGRTGLFDSRVLIARARELGADRPAVRLSGTNLDWIRIDELRRMRAIWGTLRVLESGVEGLLSDAVLRTDARRAYRLGQNSEALRLWSEQGESPRQHGDVLLLAESLAASGDSRAEPWIDEIASVSPGDGWALRGLLASRADRPDEAAAAYIEMLKALRDDGFASRKTISRALEEIKEVARRLPSAAPALYEASSQPFALYLRETDRQILRVSLVGRLENVVDCVDAFRRFEEYPAWERYILEARYRCYEAADHPLLEQARRDWELFVRDAGENQDQIEERRRGPASTS